MARLAGPGLRAVPHGRCLQGSAAALGHAEHPLVGAAKNGAAFLRQAGQIGQCAQAPAEACPPFDYGDVEALVLQQQRAAQTGEARSDDEDSRARLRPDVQAGECCQQGRSGRAEGQRLQEFAASASGQGHARISGSTDGYRARWSASPLPAVNSGKTAMRPRVGGCLRWTDPTLRRCVATIGHNSGAPGIRRRLWGESCSRSTT
jgi:hypothetical protein